MGKPEVAWYCPLLGKNISEVDCYEVNIAGGGF